MPQVGIYSASLLAQHDHSSAPMGGVLDHADLTNVLSAQHHALPNLGDLVFNVGCSAHLNGNQSIPNNTTTKVLWDDEDYDVGSDFDADGVDSNFTVPSTGYYLIHVQVCMQNLTAGKYSTLYVYIDGGLLIRGGRQEASTVVETYLEICSIEHLTAGQVIDVRVKHNQGAGINCQAGRDYSYFQMEKIGE